MLTYYAAQLGVSLSVVDSKASYLDSLNSASKRCISASGETPMNRKEMNRPSISELWDNSAGDDSEYHSESSNEDDLFKGLRKKYPISSF